MPKDTFVKLRPAFGQVGACVAVVAGLGRQGAHLRADLLVQGAEPPSTFADADGIAWFDPFPLTEAMVDRTATPPVVRFTVRSDIGQQTASLTVIP